MDADVPRTELDAKTLKRIWRKAMNLSQQEGFRRNEWPDLQQELTLHVLQQLPRYDPRRGKLDHFLANMIRRKATDMLRIRRAKRRGYQLDVRSLHETLSVSEDEQVEIGDLPMEDAVRAQQGLSSHLTEEQIHCRIDVLRVEATLTARQREICRRLRSATITEVAAELEMPRSSLYEEIARIRDAFRKAGLDEYL